MTSGKHQRRSLRLAKVGSAINVLLEVFLFSLTSYFSEQPKAAVAPPPIPAPRALSRQQKEGLRRMYFSLITCIVPVNFSLRNRRHTSTQI